MKILAAVLIASAVLYPTIWPHEVGHGVVAYAYGCKSTLLKTNMSWMLWSSWSGKDIDEKCLKQRGHAAVAWTAFGGVAVNLLLLVGAAIASRMLRRKAIKVDPSNHGAHPRSWWLIGLFFWALANYAEAFSYLVLNTAWLKSDMAVVVKYSGINHWIWCLANCILAIAIAGSLKPIAQTAAGMLATPGLPRRRWIGLFVLYVGLVGGAMAEARIKLT